jgi:hydrogenase maturation protease
VTARVLVYGYGNPGRLDDGLGPALVRGLAAKRIGDFATLECGYQLQIEDAALVAEHRVVVFADADRVCHGPFELRPLLAGVDAGFTTHSVSPATLLALARKYFGSTTVGFTLGIRGYEFEAFGEGLSPGAQLNLIDAVEWMAGALENGTFGREPVAADREG